MLFFCKQGSPKGGEGGGTFGENSQKILFFHYYYHHISFNESLLYHDGRRPKVQALEQVMHVEEREPARLGEKMYFLTDFSFDRGPRLEKNYNQFFSPNLL